MQNPILQPLTKHLKKVTANGRPISLKEFHRNSIIPGRFAFSHGEIAEENSFSVNSRDRASFMEVVNDNEISSSTSLSAYYDISLCWYKFLYNSRHVFSKSSLLVKCLPLLSRSSEIIDCVFFLPYRSQKFCKTFVAHLVPFDFGPHGCISSFSRFYIL